MKILFFLFFSILIVKPAFAQGFINPAGGAANLTSLATKQYFSGKTDESLALYQKAIAKSESEYGKNSRFVADLYYQLGVRAFWLSKFNLAERSFKKAVEINPNGEAAQLMLVNLLRFRHQDFEAYNRIQQGLKKHPDSAPLRKDLAISLQDKDPSRATEQAFLVNCIQNGLTEKIPGTKPEPPAKPKISEQKEQKEAKEKDQNKKNSAKDKLANKKAKTTTGEINNPRSETQETAKAIYEPIKKDIGNSVKPIRQRSASSHRRANTTNTNRMPAGLVPPPPPEMLGMPTTTRGIRARAGSIKLESPQPAHLQETDETKKHTVEHSTAESDPDFLIEWASVKKKTPAKK